MSNSKGYTGQLIGSVILLAAAAWVYFFSEIGQKTEVECQINALGEGHCQFTNLGWTPGASCVNVGIKNGKGKIAPGSLVCSGRVWPNDTTRKDVSISIPSGHCSSDCDIDISFATSTENTNSDDSIFQPYLEPKNMISMGRCHMGSCSWAKWLSVEVLSATPKETELLVLLLGGDSEHEDDYPDSAEEAKINWNREPHEVRIRCSLKRPSTTLGNQTTIIPLNPDLGIPGVLESSTSLYMLACHSHHGGPDEIINKYGYKVS